MRDLIVPDRRILSRSLCVRIEKTLAPSSSLELEKNPGGICSAWTVAPCHHCPSLNFPWNQVILCFPWQAWVENLSQRWECRFLDSSTSWDAVGRLCTSSSVPLLGPQPLPKSLILSCHLIIPSRILDC